jgi:hypothetical protein
MALVDPFIPQPKPRGKHHPQAPVGNRSLEHPIAQAVPGNTSQAQSPRLHKKTFEVPLRRVGRIRLILQGVAIAVLAVVLGLAASAQSVGEAVIVVYAVVALITRLPSGVSFALALLSFMMIVLLEILRPMSDLAANFAVYAFLLLVVGMLSLCLEVRQAAKWKKWRRQFKRKNRG